ncbi:MAG: hypothetical protein M3378_09525 [Actinomycetota bacterium]|nr:hypothetical protein [Actinomycetota bacterium]
METPGERPLSALPSARARALAFAAILVAGVCGGLIGASLVNIQCTGDCATPSGLAAIVVAVVCAGGVALVSVLVLRAMGEWRTIDQERLDGDGAGGGAEGDAGQPVRRSSRKPSA